MQGVEQDLIVHMPKFTLLLQCKTNLKIILNVQIAFVVSTVAFLN